MKKPRILVYDIETTPYLAYVWGKYKQDVISFKKYRELLSFSYCWYGEGKKITHHNRIGQKTDEALTKRLGKLAQQADIVIGHNGDEFDRKVLKTRMLFWKMTPLKPNCSVDPRNVGRKYFSFPSNSLNDICQYLGIGKKLSNMTFDVWEGCMAKEAWALKRMEKYNNHDVALVRDLYTRLQNWIEDHPTMAPEPPTNYEDAKPTRKNSGLHGVCPFCQSWRVRRNGFRRTLKTLRQRLNCQGCGKWWEGKAVKP